MKTVPVILSLIAVIVISITFIYALPNEIHEKTFHEKQYKLIENHKKALIDAGRITDPSHFFVELYLARYGWFNGICDEDKYEKASPCSFGSYVFYQPAYEQAKKIFVIHGTIDANTDILIDDSYQKYIPDKNGLILLGSTDGSHSSIGNGAFDNSIIGYNVQNLSYCEKYGNHLKYCEGEDNLSGAKVIEFIDKGHVRIDKIAKHDAAMYGLVIMPDDYKDMCQCTLPMYTSSAPI